MGRWSTDSYLNSPTRTGMPESLSVEQRFVRFAPCGYMELGEAVTLIGCVLAYCREQHQRRLLVDATNLYGFGPPTIGERYRIALQWARIADSEVIAAMVARPELIHPEQVIVYVAAREGFRCGAFTEESAAVEWLLSQVPQPKYGLSNRP
jgi:hypothetical protein